MLTDTPGLRGRWPQRAVFAAGAFLVLSVAAPGCGTDRSPVKARAARASSSVPTSVDPNAPSPLEAAFGGPQGIAARRYRWQEQEKTLVAKCMNRSGYNYPDDIQSERSVLYDYLVNKWQTVIGDAEYRQRWGYGVSTAYRPDGTQYSRDNAMLTEGAPRGQFGVGGDPSKGAVSYLEALMGSEAAGTKGDVNGCTAESFQRMDSDYPAFRKLNNVEQEIDKQAISSSEMGEAVKAFLACMSENGYETEDPANTGALLLQEDFGTLFVNQQPGPNFAERLVQFQQRELALAKLEWSCREKTLNPVLANIRWQVETALLERSSDLVAQVKRQGP